ncbi:glutamyl-tRNA synthetase [Auriscalpium vulgare]|uniref:Glutamyl-tRNA synthetase n=1 Tax=Auriscalpium vulgare TaxID=40419 RepID=A0ACB8RPG3_9AGAM|nr:glutamyl-tRNA synthetase [Auriscalpium vulgare]
MTALLRFAPSPTGPLHLGGLRTALFNHVMAKKLGGKWILRIEDTDQSRTVPGSLEEIQEGLAWAGLDYDYGPNRPGPHGPYFQSQRLDLYHSYAHKLVESGHAYRCFCTPDRLAETRERLARAGLNSTYDKACLTLTEEEVARRVKAGEKNIVRLNVRVSPCKALDPKDVLPDLIFGGVRDAHASLPTDPVLLKTDLFPTYHLANVVDDHEMGVTHVLRGEEWLPSLPLHRDLYASLGLTPPRFAHLPLLLNPDGSKMSKRNGDVRVKDFSERGWEPEALLNWLALAGWGVSTPPPSESEKPRRGHGNPHSRDASPLHEPRNNAPDSTTVMTLPEIIDNFDLSVLTHRRTVVDSTKLLNLNKAHIWRTSSTDAGLTSLAERVRPLILEAFPKAKSKYTGVDYLKQVIVVLRGRLATLSDLPSAAPYFFVDLLRDDAESRDMLTGISHAERQDVLTRVDSVLTDDAAATAGWTAALHARGVEGRAAMTVVRHALSGMKSGPSLPEIFDVLGKERALQRVDAALEEVKFLRTTGKGRREESS